MSMQKITQNLRILFVYLSDSKSKERDMEKNLTELWGLVMSLGDAEVIDIIIQKGKIFRETYIGPGKAEEIAGYLKNQPVDVICANGVLTSNQKFNLTKMYWDINPRIKVWDRVDLILAIFSKHAHTKEAQLQIELARMHHMGPSIYGMGMILSRQSGGIGTRGIGETNTEIMKRHWKREIKRVSDTLSKLINNKHRQIESRKKTGLKTVSLVGYTNAGKTMLFNLLTHKNNPVKNTLFCTLDSTVGKIFIPQLQKDVIVSDTIGFIKDLPPALIEAFKSTLLESINADIVLHVVDISDPFYPEKIKVVEEILTQLKIPGGKIILVFNKIDVNKTIDEQIVIEKYISYRTVFLSAKTHAGLESLISLISEKIN